MFKIYFVTGDSFGVITQRDGAWRAHMTSANRKIQCLTVDHSAPDTIFVGSRGEGVWRSDDGGFTWGDLHLPEADVFSLAVSPADQTIYAGTEPSRLFRSGDSGASWEELPSLREIPSAPTWSFPPRPWTSHVRWIAPCPHEADRLLVGIELGGVMLSEDGGKTWRDHPEPAVKDCHALAWHPCKPGRAYEAGGGGGAAWSKDGGKTWERTDEGLDRLYGWGLAVDPEDPDLWYLSASPGAGYAHHSDRDARAHIYRRLGDAPWERLEGGLPQPLDAMPYALATSKGGLILAGLSDGSLYVSRDAGDHWQEIEVAGDTISCIRAMAVVDTN